MSAYITACDNDDSGSLYFVVECPRDHFAAVYMSVDAQKSLFTSQNKVNLKQLAENAIQLIAQPSIDFQISSISVSGNGHYLLLSGYRMDEHAVVAVMDILGGTIMHNVISDKQMSSPSSTSNTSASKLCPLLNVDPQLFASCIGLKVFQVSWNPHSAEHLALLTSDSRLRLYALHDVTLAEQTFNLSAALAASLTTSGIDNAYLPCRTSQADGVISNLTPVSRARGLGLRSMQDKSEDMIYITAFTWGPFVSWGYFSVNILSSTGAVFSLSPICAWGSMVPASILKQIILEAKRDYSDCSAATRTASSPLPVIESNYADHDTTAAASNDDAMWWLKQVFGSDAVDSSFEGQNAWVAASYTSGGTVVQERSLAVPCLCGPLNDLPESAATISDRTSKRSADTVKREISHNSHHLAVTLSTSYQLQFSKSTVQRHHSHISGLQKTDYAADDAVLLSQQTHRPSSVMGLTVIGYSEGLLLAYVSHCNFRCPRLRWESSWPQLALDKKGQVRAARFTCPLVSSRLPEDSGEGMCTAPLQLVDCVDLQISAALPADGILDDSKWLQTLHYATCRNRFKLLPSAEDPQSMWAVHRTGCWKISFPWLTALSKLVCSAVDAGSVTTKVLDQEMEVLPPPSVRELLYVTEEAVILQAACVMSDMFLGDGLLIAVPQSQENSQAGSSTLVHHQGLPLSASCETANSRFQFFMRKKAATPAEPLSGPSPAAFDTGLEVPLSETYEGVLLTSDTNDDASCPVVESKRVSLLNSNLESIYGELTSCPVLKLKNTRSGATISEGSEGPMYLHDCTQQLHEHYIEFIHRADQDMRQRMLQLNSETSTQRKALEELKASSQAAQQKGCELLARVKQAADLQRNLADRAEILAQLHWSLPRPQSDAELQMMKYLTVAKAQAEAAQHQWLLIQSRLQALKKHPMKPAASDYTALCRSESTANITTEQAAKVLPVLTEHSKLLGRAVNDLRGLEDNLDTWRASNSSICS
ncbi:hypothetical protein CEUSTIGMA_g12872.t1 [Chlamydomonas eustigma]|uniref:Uncharacterized protein n=1 Tax=Chlamydomonas eustigma TaxID=1157962 RepID=A0A250XQY0_9CHLO|nr:hypothetical protein CEUSTIGMA_g12872.t1 [Chlamydomonas eustigma]|eukprot:GAX85456.1 hypothetical protein CEUSTIGMA_g12872.t1 [Chlamydomonas eustigma]